MSKPQLWYTRCPVPTAFSLAVQNDWLNEEFAADNIRVQSLLQSTDRTTRESHFAHTQANSFRHGGNTPPLWARASGSDVRLIGLSWTPTAQDLLVRADSPIRQVADLKGRRLAVPRRTNDLIDFWRAHVLQVYEKALASANLTLDDVQLVDLVVERRFIDGSGEAESAGSLWNAFQMEGFQREETVALVQGEVDVIFSYGPRSLQKQALLGARVIYALADSAARIDQTSNSLPLAFTVSGELLDQHPDLVARVLARTLQAAEWAKANATQATRIVAREIGVAEEFIERSYGNELIHSLGVDLSAENINALRVRKDFLLQNGFLPQDVDIEQWIDRGPLHAAHQILAERARNAA